MDIAGPNSLIRLLRAPDDPPTQDGPSKIAIAQTVWSDSSDIPGKADIIRDWIYNTWDKQGKGQGVITLDQAHLDLLDSILSFTSQALPPHLLSLYFRTHTATLPGPSFKQHQLWENGARRCKASSDAWVEIWIEMIKCLGQDGSSLDLELVRVIEVKVGDSIALMPISKKNSLAVLSVLVDISKAFAQHTTLSSDVLGSIIYPASSLKIAKTTLSCLGALPATTTTLQFIPRLLCALESSVRNNRYDIFVQPTSSKTPYQTYTNGKVRSYLCTAIREAQALLPSVGAGLTESDLWRCRGNVWRDVANWGVYVESDQGWRDLLVVDIEKAKNVIRGQPDTETVGTVLSFLTIAEELDHMATNVEVNVMAWCLAAPSLITVRAEEMLSATFRYHRLSQSPEAWVTLVLASVEQLLAASVTAEATRSIHQLILGGPLFSDRLWQQFNTIRKTDRIVDELLSRIQALTNLDSSSAITVDIISYLAMSLCAESEHSITSLVVAIEALLLPVNFKRRDAAYEVALAALVRLGRMGNSQIRARLDSEFGLAAASSKASSAELREEICQWLVARIGDAPEQAQELLDSLVVAVQQNVTRSCWNALDREGLSALEHSATSKQLDSLFAVRAESELQWLLTSAETTEMPRVMGAILKATLARMSKGQPSGSMSALFASLPSTILDDPTRQTILDLAQAADAHANDEASYAIRQSLAHLIRGSSVKVHISYWTLLQADAVNISEARLQACTRELVKAFIELAMNTESELDRLLGSLSNDTARTLAAEVAVGHDAARVPTKVKSRLARMVDEMATVQTPSTPAPTLLSIRKLRHWCDATVVESSTPFRLESIQSLGPAELELLRLECHDGRSLMDYLALLMSKSEMITSETLQKEVMAVAGQTSDLEAIIRCCLAWIAARAASHRPGGFAVLFELLSIRRQGSGKAILRCREALLDTLLAGPGDPSSAQLAAIKAFVRLRSKLLRVSDVGRIISTLSISPNAASIDIVHAGVLTRSDLVIHVLPILARFLCNSFDCIHEPSAPSLGRLLSNFGNRRSPKSTRDTPLALPFSKHAPAVLVAYVRSVTRPHNPLTIATRRTLQMSVYTICDAVIRSQDRGHEGEGIGIPFGLGESGEAEQEIWAELWKQWAKQRYRGQG